MLNFNLPNPLHESQTKNPPLEHSEQALCPSPRQIKHIVFIEIVLADLIAKPFPLQISQLILKVFHLSS